MQLLPIDIGRFHLVGPGEDSDLRRESGGYAASEQSEMLAARGATFMSCRTQPDEELAVIHLALYDAGDLVGTFSPYDLEVISDDGVTVVVSAMVSPGLGSEPASQKWSEDIAELMHHFLENTLPCEDGRSLDVREWRFPLESRGDDPEHEWFGPLSYANPDLDVSSGLSLFISEFASLDVTIEVDERGVPSRAVLSGGG